MPASVIVLTVAGGDSHRPIGSSECGQGIIDVAEQLIHLDLRRGAKRAPSASIRRFVPDELSL